MKAFDPLEHILLHDIAHQHCIQQESELDDFAQRVRSAGYDTFDVEMPDWPFVLRTPLPIITFSIGGDGGSTFGGPTADMKWEGTQLAVNRAVSGSGAWDPTVKGVRTIARQMVPDWQEPAHRLAYAWQVEVFDPAKHVVIRFWCRDNGIDIVDFWRHFYPDSENDLKVIETTNPEIASEKERGSYSPTRRSIQRTKLYLLRNYYFGTDEKPLEIVDLPPKPPQPRMNLDDRDCDEQDVEWDINVGAKVFEWTEVAAALNKALGQEARMFSGSAMDGWIAAITPEAMTRYLVENNISKLQYVRETDEGRNFDCDDFALTLRADLIRDHGLNSCAVVAGNSHAWCAFILVGDHGLEVAFIEPQTDGLVTDLIGQYAVDKRCEVLL